MFQIVFKLVGYIKHRTMWSFYAVLVLCFTSIRAGNVCEGDLVYQACGVACPNKCGETPRDVCADVCVEGCACHSNQWRNGTKCYDKPTVEGECAPPTCPGDFVYKTCGTACPNECGKVKPEMCTFNCVIGCQCEDNKWQQGTNCYDNATACPPPQCHGNTTFREDGTTCEQQCGQPTAETCLPVSECQCRSDQWRHGDNCYDNEDECPAETKCDGDLIYTSCGTACENICHEPEAESCTYQCVIGCQCKSNQWRQGNRCYDNSTQCPPACPGDLKYTECGTACEKECRKEPPEMCTLQCVQGCQCELDQWRDGDLCFEKSADCPAECPGDTNYNKCGTACEKMCGEPEPTACTYQCVLGCQCRHNQWRHNDDCFDNEEDCPTTEEDDFTAEECEGDLVFNECGTACEKTCGEPAPEMCTLQCVIGCQCEDNEWRNDTRCYEDESCSSGFQTVANIVTVILCLIFTLYNL